VTTPTATAAGGRYHAVSAAWTNPATMTATRTTAAADRTGLRVIVGVAAADDRGSVEVGDLARREVTLGDAEGSGDRLRGVAGGLRGDEVADAEGGVDLVELEALHGYRVRST
jgi:Zn-dependent alcohol dehydrogenase